MPDGIPQLLTLLAVARALCVSPHTVRSWVRKGKLRPTRLCRRLLFHPDEIARFLVEAKTGYAPRESDMQSQVVTEREVARTVRVSGEDRRFAKGVTTQ
jgi:predicted site-specific integrase-resolvase